MPDRLPPPWGHLLGARLLETYPLVPLSPRQALNVAVLSYDRQLHWGVNADYDVVPDVSDFVAALAQEAELLRKTALAYVPPPLEASQSPTS